MNKGSGMCNMLNMEIGKCYGVESLFVLLISYLFFFLLTMSFTECDGSLALKEERCQNV